MKFSAAYLLLVVALNVALVKGEFPIPKREVGFVYGGGKAEAPITVDLYIDLQCSDSRPALATLRSVADHYGPNTLRLTTHLCPLPYKRNAFHAAMGAHVVHAVTNGSATFDWMSTVYDNMYSLSNYATFHMSEQDVFWRLTGLASEVGVSSTQFIQGISGGSSSHDAKVEWKYCCTRGVAEVPAFMINDVTVLASQSWTLDDWRGVIDPLLDGRT